MVPENEYISIKIGNQTEKKYWIKILGVLSLTRYAKSCTTDQYLPRLQEIVHQNDGVA